MDDLDIIEKEILEKKQNALVQPSQKVANVTEPTDFSKAVDNAKIESLKNAAATDEKFVKDFTEQLKQATLKAAQVEEEKQELEKQNVKYAQELLETQQKLNEKAQKLNDWEKKQKRREYHYDGVKPIMEFVGIKEPMNLLLLYFLTSILVWFFLLSKLFKGTIGALIAGAETDNRPKAVKGFMWTLLAVIVLAVASSAIYLLLQWLAII